MAEQSAQELAETNPEQPNSTVAEMDLEAGSEPNSKRAREEGADSGEENDGVSKKQKVGGEKSVEEERLDKKLGEGDEESGPVKLGPKTFGSSVEMFDYLYKFLHYWPTNLNVNKYEHMVLLDLLNKGHPEPDKKIGEGISAFQVRYHPMWKSRCFFLIRNDESSDDFSFRKCVDRILPLPEDMKTKSNANKPLGGGSGKGRGGRGGRGGGRGGWRGKSKN